jgi:hypothetical protein
LIGEDAGAPELRFAVRDVDPLDGAATPTLRFWLWIEAGPRALRGLSLAVRLQIRAERRRYDAGEGARLRELFGSRDDFSRSLGRVPWTQAALHVGPFERETVAELRVPCTYDFEVAATKYLAALEDGEVPLELLFSGTMLWRDPSRGLQTAMIPWDCEANIRMPVEVWRSAMRASFGDTAWLRLHRDVFARLQEFRSQHGLTSWEQTLEALLESESR